MARCPRPQPQCHRSCHCQTTPTSNSNCKFLPRFKPPSKFPVKHAPGIVYFHDITLFFFYSKPSNRRPHILISIHKTNEHVELDFICWKILLTECTTTRLASNPATAATAGQPSVAVDIIQILNQLPPSQRKDQSNSNKRGWQIRQRRHSTASSSSSAPAYQHYSKSSSQPPLHSLHEDGAPRRRGSVADQQQQEEQQDLPTSPQVWIRVAEADLTTVWTALSGFRTQLDTGNYGSLKVGIRVVRASRYLVASAGPLKNKW